MSRIAIEKAKQIHEKYLGLRFPLDVEQLAQKEGCECIDWPFREPVQEVKRGRWIGLANKLSPEERRYLVAHALAHQFLHCGNQLAFHSWQKTCHNRQEKEADCCAAHILMPEDELGKVIHLPLWEIAERFGVAEELVKKRLTAFASEKELARWEQAEA
jgi:Zn-dependent peptidase ImmA (M78 family)